MKEVGSMSTKDFYAKDCFVTINGKKIEGIESVEVISDNFDHYGIWGKVVAEICSHFKISESEAVAKIESGEIVLKLDGETVVWKGQWSFIGVGL